MRFTIWNCCGMARPAATRSLRALERKFYSDILFLSETKVYSLATLLVQLGFVNFVEWPSNGRKGGLVLAWKLGVDLEVMMCNENMINAIIYSDPPNQPWMLTGIYAPVEWNKKERFWNSVIRWLINLWDRGCVRRILIPLYHWRTNRMADRLQHL